MKPENIIFLNEDELAPLKIIDFGCADRGHKENMNSYIGTTRYMAPEIIKCYNDSNVTYNYKCDVFSLGCLLYLMLSGI